jgi:hypothetical protein
MTRRVLWIVVATLVVAGVTALIFLVRAGDPYETNWPITFELRTSDNGVLFQFAQDVFSGRSLDWSFSPQVYVFPEIPISLVAYLLAGGAVQVYYLAVAVIDAALLYLALYGLVRYLFPSQSLRRKLIRAGIALFPVLLLALLGNTWLFEYPLAPTYYFGMYLAILLVPILFFSRSRVLRILIASGLVLTAASNPLTLVFVVPALVCVGIVAVVSSGWRSVRRPVAVALVMIAVALLIRFTLFARLQGTSPFTYVSGSIFSTRVGTIGSYVRSLLAQSVETAVVLQLGALLAVTGLVLGLVVAIRALRRGSRSRVTASAEATTIYFALVPIGGLAGTAVLLITDQLYLWPVLVLPMVLALVPLPQRWVTGAAVIAVVALVVAAGATGAITNLGRTNTYFAYQLPETRCLDQKLPAGMTTGYATFSDARPIELVSSRGIRLVQLKSSGVRAYWLTNRDYARDEVGRFFFINHRGDEPAISVKYIESHFGTPDATFDCAPGQKVLIYTSATKLAKIKARYSTLPAP